MLSATILTIGLLVALSTGTAATAPDECELPGPDGDDYVCQVLGAFDWADTTQGQTLNLATDDVSAPLDLPFDFDWYGEIQTDVHVSSKGLLCFAPDDPNDCIEIVAQAVPDQQAPNNLITCGWEDLDPERGSVTYNETTVEQGETQAFVVEYHEVPYYQDSETNTFQIQLLEDGRARCMLDEITDRSNGWPMSVGTENATGEEGVRYTISEFSANDIAVGFGQVLQPPVNVNAEAGLQEVNVTWDEPAETSGIEGYTVYKRSTPDSDPTIFTVPSNETWFHDEDLGDSETWYYEVATQNRVGDSAASQQVQATTYDAPSAPLELTAEPGDERPEITLTWSAPQHANETQWYHVYKHDATGEETPWVTNVTATTWTDANNTAGTEATYNVTAVNIVGESQPSNNATSFPAGPTEAPSAPENLEASPGTQDRAIKLTWDGPTDPREADSINVYRSTSEGAFEQVANVSSSVSTYEDTGLQPGTEYTYHVTAVNVVGESDPSNDAASLPEGPTAVPSEPRDVQASPGDEMESITLTWSAPQHANETQWYHVYKHNATGEETPWVTNVTATTWTDANNTAGTEATYNVTAVNIVGESQPSNNATSFPAGPPGPPTDLTASEDGVAVQLDWEEPISDGGSEVVEYEVERKVVDYFGIGETGFGFRASVDASKTAFKDTAGIECAQVYVYRVYAINDHGSSAPQQVDQRIEDGCAPAPTGANATAGENEEFSADEIQVTWDDEGAPEYFVFVCEGDNETCKETPFEDWDEQAISASPFEDAGLDAGEARTYAIAVDDGGAKGLPSGFVAAQVADEPSPPENVEATSETGGSTVTIEWDAPSDDGGATLQAYDILRDNTVIGTVSADVHEFEDEPPEPGEWCYTVQADNTFKSDQSTDDACATSVGVTVDCGGPPGMVPAACPDAPQNLVAESDDVDLEIALTWSAPDGELPGTEELVAYRVYQGQGESCSANVAIADVSETQFTVTGLESETAYCFAVTAIRGTTATTDTVPLEGPPSNPDSATTIGAPQAPEDFTAKAGTDLGEIKLSWTDANVEDYTIYRSTTSDCTDIDEPDIEGAFEEVTTTDASPFVDEELPAGTYCFAVTATNGAGEGPPAWDTAEASNEAPDAPTGVSVENPEAGALDVEWSEPANTGGSPIHSYVLERRASDGDWDEIATIPGDEGTAYEDDGLAPGVEFCYRLTAVNTALDENGEESPGLESTVTTEVCETA